ncbi:murein hydrolase regulator LrgA [Clostridium sp. chh4-2]|uniref:CidA/LrgA family protein n=1 Tax=Clostridium sp. chh4-2 TaxID=2067550 RepID=UPI000CCFA1B7|nr:CidA/LrgA family protein [Clostridium sp. chh4-2]PNV59491.1 murein hydrolase regulator LrgA [Clostridium sp. chh4-2]
MKYLKQISIIFGITMIGELLNQILPFPVPSGVYGLFLLLFGLCSGIIKLEHVEQTGNLLLDLMPLMFVPVSVGLLNSFEELKAVMVPLIVISVVSTIVVMTVTGKMAEWIIRRNERRKS